MQPTTNQIITPKKSKKKSLILSLVALLLLTLIATASFLILKKDKPEPTAQSTTTQTKQAEQDPTATKTISINYPKTAAYDGNDTMGGLFTIQAPQNWQVYSKEESDPTDSSSKLKLTTYYIGNPAGNYNLELKFGLDGLGGACQDNTQTYTLTKKLPTKISGYYWKEYDFEKGIRFEHTVDSGSDAGVTKNNNLQEGESNTNTCNISPYPALPTQDDQLAAFLQVVAGNAKDKGENLPNSDMNDRVSYKELQSEPGFVQALQTVNYTN